MVNVSSAVSSKYFLSLTYLTLTLSRTFPTDFISKILIFMGNNSETFLEEVHQIHNPNRNLFSSRKQKIKHKNVVD